MTVFGLIVFLACTPTALLDFAIPKWQVDKNVHIEDAYKYLYQATRGGEHAAPSRESAKQWLDNEWKSLAEPVKGEVSWESLCPGGEVGRFNLRPFKAKGGEPDELLDAFLASASEYRSDAASFTDVWVALGKRLKKKKIGKLDHKSWTTLDAEMKKKNYPAVHHSDVYNHANRPAYRILTSAQAEQLISP